MTASKRYAAGACVVIAALIGCTRHREEPVVTIATTPEIAGIGLVPMLADAFSAESKTRTNIVVTEERFIPDLARKGELDVVITTSPDLARRLNEAKLVSLSQRIGEIDLSSLVEQTPLLRKDVTMMLTASERRRANAQWFVQWVMSYRGREAIERYRYDGDRRLFVAER
jgi:ABC-type tungstate transport system permease subunit